MATHKPIKPNRRPSTALGLFFLLLVFCFVLFCIWQMFFIEKTSHWKLGAQHFLTACASCVAFLGVVFTAALTLRNTVRQHTVTTLLQSRLSATYMKYADDLSTHYIKHDKACKENPANRVDVLDGIDTLALRYILNYFEFIAVGIKRGDLDEDMLYDSLRGILAMNVKKSHGWIKMLQIETPTVYEHVLWLNWRWTLRYRTQGKHRLTGVLRFFSLG